MFSSGYGHFAKLGFNFFDNLGHYRAIHMRDLVVVDIPGNGALLSFNLAVRDAKVVRIQLETHLDQRV